MEQSEGYRNEFEASRLRGGCYTTMLVQSFELEFIVNDRDLA